MRRADAVAGLAGLTSAAALCLSLPPLRVLIEQGMAWHMAVQMPLLLAAGALTAWASTRSHVARALGPWNAYGLSGLILAQVALAYWMLPSAIDRAVVLPAADAAKLLTLWLAGAALRHAAERAPPVLQLFFIGYTVPMLMWLGFYFAGTERRLCNAYSLASQVQAGWALVGWGIALAGGWLGWIGWRHVTPRRWHAGQARGAA